MLALLGSLAMAAAATTASAADHPPELDGGPDCTLWRGTVSGNDATVRMMFRLCPGGGDTIAGTGQWSSKVSGYNVRKLSGRWLDQGARLELRDEAVIEQHPQPGWRFCKIDRYDLTRHGDELTGTYDSRACNDHATVEVSLVPSNPSAAEPLAASSSPPPSIASAPLPAPSDTPPLPKDTKPPTSKACGCSSPGQPGACRGALGPLVALAGARVLRRRRRIST
jgi:hypothetical protein